MFYDVETREIGKTAERGGASLPRLPRFFFLCQNEVSPSPSKTENEMSNSNSALISGNYAWFFACFSGFSPRLPIIGGFVFGHALFALSARSGLDLREVQRFFAHRVLDRPLASLGVIDADHKGAALGRDILHAFGLFAARVVNLGREQSCRRQPDTARGRAHQKRAHRAHRRDAAVVHMPIVLDVLRHRDDVAHQRCLFRQRAATHLQIAGAGDFKLPHFALVRAGRVDINAQEYGRKEGKTIHGIIIGQNGPVYKEERGCRVRQAGIVFLCPLAEPVYPAIVISP